MLTAFVWISFGFLVAFFALLWQAGVLRLYYALYRLVLGEMLDGLLLLLLGIIVGIVGGRRGGGWLKLGVASCLILCVLAKLFAYISPFLAAMFCGPEAFEENVQALTEPTRAQYETLKAAFGGLFAAFLSIPTLLLVIVFVDLFCEDPLFKWGATRRREGADEEADASGA